MNYNYQIKFMRKIFLLFFLIISTFSFAQTKKKAEKLNVNGIIIFRFIGNDSSSYCCELRTKIIIDSTGFQYDFIAYNNVNNNIIRENKELRKMLGSEKDYYTDDFLFNLFVSNQLKNATRYDVDSIINSYKMYNIYDTILYKQLREQFLYTLTSDCIYKNNSSDSLFIALAFKGSIIKYKNVVYADRTDDKDTTQTFDNNYFYNKCHFVKLNKTFITLNKVDELKKLTTEQLNKLGLIKSKRTKIEMTSNE